MYKVGDEVFVKGEIVEVIKDVPYPIKVEVCCTTVPLLFTEEELFTVRKTYEQGLADAWELAKKIAKMSYDECRDIFGKGGFHLVAYGFTVEEALAKIEAYEKKENEIKVGDEVIHETDSTKRQFFVTYIGGNMISGIEKNGDTHGFSFPNQYIRKTGKHIDIEEFLKQLREQ